MAQPISHYPLTWPDGVPRTERKAESKFKTTQSAALSNVETSLLRFGQDSGNRVTDIILSSNVGGLRSDFGNDPGVAAWFTWDGQQRCIAVDRYPKPADNLQAIHHIIEARRTELRHGGLHIVRQTFKGFFALPAPDAARDWWKVLGLPNANVSRHDIDVMYRRNAQAKHPDQPGGSHEKMAELNIAYEAAKLAVPQ